MPTTTEPRVSRHAPGAPRRHPVALGVSLLLHVGAVYALTRSAWHVPDVRPPPPSRPAVVWMRDLPRPEPEAPPAPTVKPAEQEPPAVVEPPQPERAAPPPRRRVARRSVPAEEPAPASPAPEPPAQPAPRIDWDKERRAAARATIENPQPGFRTFSAED